MKNEGEKTKTVRTAQNSPMHGAKTAADGRSDPEPPRPPGPSPVFDMRGQTVGTQTNSYGNATISIHTPPQTSASAKKSQPAEPVQRRPGRKTAASPPKPPAVKAALPQAGPD